MLFTLFPEQEEELSWGRSNIVEDRRIESKLLHNFPGYGWFIKSVRSYYTMKGLETLQVIDSPSFSG